MDKSTKAYFDIYISSSEIFCALTCLFCFLSQGSQGERGAEGEVGQKGDQVRPMSVMKKLTLYEGPLRVSTHGF